MLVYALISYDQFFDTEVYLFYLDDIYWFSQPGWFLSEPAAKSYLLLLRWITGSTTNAVQAAHFVIGAVYLLGTLIAYRPSKADPRGMLVAFALYGPQLAFVTLRATPAYIFVLLAALDASAGRRRCFGLLAIAFLFHVSSALAAVPILLAYLQYKSRLFAWAERPRNLIAVGLSAALLLLFARQPIFNLVATVVGSFPFLGKYVVFLVGLSSDANSKSIIDFSIGHFLLFAGLTMGVVVFLLMPGTRGKRIVIYVTSSYLIYTFTFFSLSPIAAWRQSAFWVLPMFAFFPWKQLGWRSGAWLPAVAVLGAVFWLQLGAVYS